MVLLRDPFILPLILRSAVTSFPLSLTPNADAHASLSSHAHAIVVAWSHVANLWQCHDSCQPSLYVTDNCYYPWPE